MYRENAKPPEKKKKLLYKKPWWQIWTPRDSWEHSKTHKKYVWHYIKKWIHKPKLPNGLDDINTLFYTASGNWVFIGHGYKGVSTNVWTWCLNGGTLEELEKEVIGVSSPTLTAAFVTLLGVKKQMEVPIPPTIYL